MNVVELPEIERIAAKLTGEGTHWKLVLRCPICRETNWEEVATLRERRAFTHCDACWQPGHASQRVKYEVAKATEYVGAANPF